MTKGKLDLYLTKKRSCKHSAYDSDKKNWKQVVSKINQAYSEGASVKILITFNERIEDGKDNK